MSDVVGIKCTYAGGKPIILDGSNPIYVTSLTLLRARGQKMTGAKKSPPNTFFNSEVQ